MEELPVSLNRAEDKHSRFLRNIYTYLTNYLTVGGTYNTRASMSPTLHCVIFQKAAIFTNNTLRTANNDLQNVYIVTRFHYSEQTEHTRT
jgi:hypothetical protein